MDELQYQNWKNARAQRKAFLASEDLFQELIKGDVAALASAITLVESKNPTDQEVAQALIQKCIPYAGKSLRVGITGVPGVGKSSFLESFGQIVVQQGKKLAILAIDPSSSHTGGSILGDKTRMEQLSILPNVFIRPSPSGEHLGGVARKTRESILLCEAAGFDLICIETVGVGQSETLVHSMVDFFLLLMLSGAGDELQGIKRGIMEMADALVITKADGENIQKAKVAAQSYKNAMHLFPPKSNQWIPLVTTCSALNGYHLNEVWEIILRFERHCSMNGSFDQNRKNQDKYWFNEWLKELILADFYQNTSFIHQLKESEKMVLEGKVTPFEAAKMIYQIYKKQA